MNDRKLSAIHTAAAVCWGVGLLLVVLDLLHLAHVHPLGLVVVGAAMTLNNRGFLCHVEQRRLRVFELGRQAGRAEVNQLMRR